MKYFSGKSWLPYSLLVIVLAAYAVAIGSREGDIDFFVETGQRFIAGKNLYQELYRGSIYFVYSPVFSFLVAPFTFIPIAFIRIVWAAINLWFVYRILVLSFSYLPKDHITDKYKTYIILCALVYTAHFYNLNLIIGQMTIFMLYICLYAIWGVQHGKRVSSAFLLALGICIKVMPVISLCYLAYHRHYKAVCLTFAFLALLFAAPLAVKPAYTLSQYKSWYTAMEDGGGGFSREYLNSMHSIHSLALVYFTDNHPETESENILPFKRSLANLPVDTAKGISYALCAALIASVLTVLLRRPENTTGDSTRDLYETGYICMVTPLVFPMQQKYGYLFLTPSVIYLAYFIFRSFNTPGKNRRQLTLLLVLFTVTFCLISLSTLDAVVGNTIKEISQYYKLIVIGAIVQLFMYLYYSPSKLGRTVE